MIPKSQLEQWRSQAKDEKSIPQMDYLDERMLALISELEQLRQEAKELAEFYGKRSDTFPFRGDMAREFLQKCGEK